MIITNKQILQLCDEIIKIKESNISLPITVSYHLIKNYNTLISYYQNILEHRDKLIKKYGSIENNKGTIFKENIVDFNNEYNTLLNISNEIDLSKIKITDCSNINFSLDTLYNLYIIIEE